MKHFAGQEYYNEVIEKIAATGGRFLSQVQISTDDFPYYVKAKYARCTTLVFDHPDKALFVVLDHNEMTGFMDEGYKNHWTIRVDCQYFPIEKLVPMLVPLMSDIDNIDSVFGKVTSVYDDLVGASMGWSSTCQGQRTFNGDIVADDNAVFTPADMIAEVTKQVFGNKESHQYLDTVFEELSTLWQPYYVFSRQERGLSDQELQKAVKNCFWQRFAVNGRTIDVTKVMREKVKYAY